MLVQGRRVGILGAATMAAITATAGWAGAARIDAVLPVANEAQRSALTRAVETFQATSRHTVSITFIDRTAVPAAVDTWIRHDGTDVVAVPAGRTLTRHARRGRLRAVADIGLRPTVKGVADAARRAARAAGRAYGVPIAYEPWGLYYHKPTFADLGLKPPETWAEFQRVARTLKANGVTPIALGAGNAWPLLAWADHLLLRGVGPATRRELLTGAASWRSADVMRALERFRTLFAADNVIRNWASLGWQAPIGHVLRGYAGMYLMGAFWLEHIPATQRERIGFVPFPAIENDVRRAERAPTMVLTVPKRADEPDAAAALIRHLAKPEVQKAVTAPTPWLPTDADVAPPARPSARAANGRRLVVEAGALVPPLDRVATPDIRRTAASTLRKLAMGRITPRQAAMALDAAADRLNPDG